MNRTLPALCTFALILFASCGSAPKRVGSESVSARATLEVSPADYVLVYLRRGPGAEGKSDEERAEVQAAHMAELDRMSRQGQLLLAGPFDSENTYPEMRGILVLDVEDIEFARGLALSDPGVQAGVLVPELMSWRADSRLRAVHELDLQALQTQEQEDENREPVFEMRKFILIDAAARGDAELALSKLRSSGDLLVFGWVLGGVERRAIFLLDAGTVEEAMDLLAPASDALDDLRAMPWWGSANLAQLPALGSS